MGRLYHRNILLEFDRRSTGADLGMSCAAGSHFLDGDHNKMSCTVMLEQGG